MIAFAVIRSGKGCPIPQCVGVFPQKFRAHEYVDILWQMTIPVSMKSSKQRSAEERSNASAIVQ